MEPSSSRAYATEYSPATKNKSQSQREYRSKEMEGFSELRDALLLVDPFDSPLGRDATRYQLLIAAAQKLRKLADENQNLVLRLSAMSTTGMQESEMIYNGMAENIFATASRIARSTDVGSLLPVASHSATHHGVYENAASQDGQIAIGSDSTPPFCGHEHQPYGMQLE